MRVSERLRYDTTNTRIDSVKQLNDETQETAISGRKLRRLSDGPAASVRVFRNRTKLENIQQFRKSIDFSEGYMSKSEDALLSLNDTLIRARELAVQSANSTYSTSDRKVVAEEIKQLIGHCIALGNTTYADRYVFAGFRTRQPPISPEGQFVGDDGQIIVQLDEDTFRPINLSGRAIFDLDINLEGKEETLIQGIQSFHTALLEDDKVGIREAISHLDRSIERVVNATAELGAKRAAVHDIVERLDKNEEQLYVDNNNLEGADPVKSTLDLKRAETALNFTLQSTAKMLQPTLLQFLQG